MNKKIFLCMFICFIFVFSCFSTITIDNNNGSKDEEIIIKNTDVNRSDKELKIEEPEKITKEVKEEKKSIKKSVIKKDQDNSLKKQTLKKDSNGLKDLLERIKQAQKERIAMKANLKITTSYIDVNNKQEVKGTMLIKKPDKFFVHYKEPSEQKLISNGENLWIYTPDLKQVIKQNIKQANLNTHFYIEFETSIDYFSKNSKNTLTETAEHYIIKMVPLKNKNIDFDEIISKINKKTLVPESMSMKFANTVIEVEFSDINIYGKNEILKLNEFNDKNFEFVLPEGIEEIEASSLLKAE